MMYRLLLYATLCLVLAPGEVSAGKCDSITGRKCFKKDGCKWGFKTGVAKRKSCSEQGVEDATILSESSCPKFEKKNKCERNGCEWRRGGKRHKSCNVPEVAPTAPPTAAPTVSPTAAPTAPPTAARTAAPTSPEQGYTELDGCCRVSNWKNKPDELDSERFQGVTKEKADVQCATNCLTNADCNAYQLIKMKPKRKDGKKVAAFDCQLYDSAVDTASRKSRACKRGTCNIYVGANPPAPDTPTAAPTATPTATPTSTPTATPPPLKLNNTVFKDAIATCLAADPVGGECANSTYGVMASWDVSRVTDYSNTFKSKTLFNGKIGGWNTSAATTFYAMFSGAEVFNQELKDWDTGDVTEFDYMFYNAAAFNQELKDWDTGAATTFESMFHGAAAFNQELKGWNTGAVTTFDGMFYGAEAFNQELNEWDTGAVTTFRYMFYDAAVFNQELKDWDTGVATTFAYMFDGAEAFDQNVSDWDTASVTCSDGIVSMFSGATATTCSVDASHVIICP